MESEQEGQQQKHFQGFSFCGQFSVIHQSVSSLASSAFQQHQSHYRGKATLFHSTQTIVQFLLIVFNSKNSIFVVVERPRLTSEGRRDNLFLPTL